MVDSLYRYNPLRQAPNTPLRDGATGTVGGSIAGGSADGRATFYIAGENERSDGVMRANELNRTSLRAIAVTFGFCLFATLVFSVGPAWRASRANLVHDLNHQLHPAPAGGQYRFRTVAQRVVRQRSVACQHHAW